MKIAIVVGTRPDIIKATPLVKEMDNFDTMQLCLINTGQHYDDNLSNNFFRELQLPKPDIQLSIGHNEDGQILELSWCLSELGETLQEQDPAYVIVTGDTTTALGAALAASKLGIPIAHVEAGCRTWDKTQTEEINRILVDHLATINFPATVNCWINLDNEKCSNTRDILGHPIVDLIRSLEIPPRFTEREYAFMTLHRRENITNKEILTNIIKNMSELNNEIPIIFPIHPHTDKQLKQFGIKLGNIEVYKPVPYLHSLSLIKHAKFVVTDSGGIIQECAILGTPCMSLINSTGWIETVREGINFLVGNEGDIKYKIDQGVAKYYSKVRQKPKDLYGKAGVSRRILDTIQASMI